MQERDTSSDGGAAGELKERWGGMLTERQERFCKEYLIDGNASAAYVRAGYNPKGANAHASRMVANGSVQARIQELMAEKDASLIASGDEVLQILTRIARRQETEKQVVVLKHRTPVECEDGKIRYQDIEVPEVVETEPKLSDVNRAAELLGKRYGLWTEKVAVEADLVRIVDDL